MNTTKTIAALFDFDGVIMDTETQYTVFWDEQGRKYLNEEDFGRRIKGQTLSQIYEKHFADKPEAQFEISAELSLHSRSSSERCKDSRSHQLQRREDGKRLQCPSRI